MLTAEIHPDGIATLRLEQPERRNALSIAMRDAISDTLEEWATDDRVRVVVLTAAGISFCAGFDLCLLCDMRIASPNAVFAHPEIKFGAPPLFTPLQWIVGAGIARELCLTGRRVDATEAHRIGLVNTIVDADRLVDAAMATARVMAEAPQAALEATKRYLVSNAGVTFGEAFEIEHDRVFDRFLLGDLGG